MGSALLHATSDPAFDEVATDPSPAGGGATLTAETHTSVTQPSVTQTSVTQTSVTETSVTETNATQAASADALRLQVAKRLAAHRSRRGHGQAEHLDIPSATPPSASTRSARIAATVAERYAHSQSYRAFLAAEAERAIQQASAAAEVAAANAQAVAAAQHRLLDAFDEDAVHRGANAHDLQHGVPNEANAIAHGEHRQELTLWPEPETFAAASGSAQPVESSTTPAHMRAAGKTPSALGAKSSSTKSAPVATSVAQGLTVRLYEDAASATLVGASLRLASARRGGLHHERNEAEALALDEEIAFRQSPVFEEPAGPPVPLPANLIEFPRQLIASRKARPRYAEGPLRDEADAAADGQLRIFEVDAAQISTEPAAAETAAHQWTSIWLDAPLHPAPGERGVAGGQTAAHADEGLLESYGFAAQFPQAAPIGRRLMAATINACIVMAALVAFAATFVVASGHPIQWQAGVPLHTVVRGMADYLAEQSGLDPGLMLGACLVAGALLYLMYLALFFSFSEATPGMRCARIALCTFDDENPTRSAMRRRILAGLLSACTLGLGFLWATIDEDRLTWHDRISRTYQRTY